MFGALIHARNRRQEADQKQLITLSYSTFVRFFLIIFCFCFVCVGELFLYESVSLGVLQPTMMLVGAGRDMGCSGLRGDYGGLMIESTEP